MRYGKKANKHETVADYANWGRIGDQQLYVSENNNNQSNIINKLNNLIGNSIHYDLIHLYEVDYYQGGNLPTKRAFYARFEPCQASKTKEHLSLIVDTKNGTLLGYTRMLKHLSGPNTISHQLALNSALSFLYQHAVDLMPAKQKHIKLTRFSHDARMIFEPKLIYGLVNLCWIDTHVETITEASSSIKLIGKKVKFYIPSLNLWAWVIVDKLGEVMTFERNISWNFQAYQRETQMWRHDDWYTV